jgi:integrase
VELPRKADADPDVRFLDDVELDELLRAVPEDGLGSVDRLIYLTAAMTGLRQGELLALRWRDVDWSAGWVRVRRSFVRGEFGQPKPRRSTRRLAPRSG